MVPPITSHPSPSTQRPGRPAIKARVQKSSSSNWWTESFLHLPIRRIWQRLISFRTSPLIASPSRDLRWNPVTTPVQALRLISLDSCAFPQNPQQKPPSCPHPQSGDWSAVGPQLLQEHHLLVRCNPPTLQLQKCLHTTHGAP